MNVFFESNKENLIKSPSDHNNITGHHTLLQDPTNSNNNNSITNGLLLNMQQPCNKIKSESMYDENMHHINLDQYQSMETDSTHNKFNLIGIETNQANKHLISAMAQHSPMAAVVFSGSSVGGGGGGDEMDDENDPSLKEIEESLAMSPGSFNNLSDIGSTSFSMGSGGANVSNHTFKKTEWDVKKFENHVRAVFGDTTPIETMQPDVLNNYINNFFEFAKKGDGMEYEPESLIGYMNSFERYLKSKNYPESLLRSDLFSNTRTMLKQKRELVRTIGRLVRIKNKDTPYLLKFYRNLFKEKDLLNRDNPDSLLAEVYLNNMIYFGDYLKEDKAWRGNLNLVWGDIMLERDQENGIEYLTLAVTVKRAQTSSASTPKAGGETNPTAVANQSRKTGTQTGKLRAAISSTAELNSPRLYARQPTVLCPVEAYKIFKARRPNNCLDRESPFYLAPNQKSRPTSKTWYQALAMSCQRLDPLFYCLFKKSCVDLNSLATMTSEQQQEIVAAATATSIETNDYVVWKSIRDKEIAQQQQQIQPPPAKQSKLSIAQSVANVAAQACYQQQQQQQQQQQMLQTQVNSIIINGQTYTVQQQQALPMQPEKSQITRVPVQVQVQVQVQVMSPLQRHQLQIQQEQQQQLVDSSATMTLL